jgi:hypothetical protein
MKIFTWEGQQGIKYLTCYACSLRRMLENPLSTSPTIKLRWYRRGDDAFYDIVQHFSFCMWAAADGDVCSHSDAAVPTGPADASKDRICAAKNCVARRNEIQDLDSDIIRVDHFSVSPTIKLRWYRRDEESFYTIVQQRRIYLHRWDIYMLGRQRLNL